MPTIAMQAARRRSIEANLFHAAHAAVEPWASFRWHAGPGEACDTFKEHSSQALAIDLFGTLAQQPDRDLVMDALARRLGVPAGGPWQIALEWHDPDNVLREKQPTWVDAAARSPHSLILFECKFSETDGGSCSQVRPIASGRHKGLVQCSGHYLAQVNPANGRLASCALSAKGIGYWEQIPDIFGYSKSTSYAPCPFAGPWFQWMRNLTTCRAVAQRHGLRPAFAVVYADGPGLPMASRVGQTEWHWLRSRVEPAAVRFDALSFQSVLGLARQASPGSHVWPELEAWIQRKVDSVCREVAQERVARQSFEPD